MKVLIEIYTAFVSIPVLRISNVTIKLQAKSPLNQFPKKFLKDIVNDLSLHKAAGGEIPLKILKECDFFFILLQTILMKL